ncbi:MAG: DUF1127 domain-containing protein [Pseudomonadota bacterium]|nr:DUF1127 domain-containing protein [Pseudomonadota bacterium]
MSALSIIHECTSARIAAKPSRLAGLVAGLMREIEIRRALRDVGTLDEATLHDIGISPGGIEDAVRCGRR